MKKIICFVILMLLTSSVGFCSDNTSNEFLVGVCNRQNRCGVVNLNNEIKIPFLYSWIQFNPGTINSKNALVAAKPKNWQLEFNLDSSKYGIIDKNGKVLVDFKYDYIFDDEYYNLKNFYKVQLGGQEGFINTQGEVLVPIKFKQISGFMENLSAATIDGINWGYIDKTGKMVIPADYTEANTFKNGYAVVCKDYKCGVIDKNGKIVVDIKYEHVNNEITRGLFAVKSNGKYGFVDTNGKTVIPFKYWSINAYNLFSEGLAAVATSRDHWGFIDDKGKTVIPFKYSDVRFFKNGYASVKKGDKWIKTDKTGKEISLQDEMLPQMLKDNLKLYDSYNFVDDVYFVKNKNNTGVLDKTGKIIVPAKYSFVYSPRYGLFQAESSSGEGYDFYDLNGNKVVSVKCKFADIEDKDLIHISTKRMKPTSNLYVIYNIDEGVIGTNGKMIIPNIYDRLEYYKNGVFIVTKDGKIALLDRNGKTLIPFGKYSAICTQNGVFSKDY